MTCAWNLAFSHTAHATPRHPPPPNRTSFGMCQKKVRWWGQMLSTFGFVFILVAHCPREIHHRLEYHLHEIFFVRLCLRLPLFHVGFTTKLCRENPSLCTDRETEPPGFWTRRI